MRGFFSPSLPFRRFFGGKGFHSTDASNSGMVYFLNLFLSHEITVTLNCGQTWKGILTEVSSDTLRIDQTKRGLEEWSCWFQSCEIGVLTGFEADLDLIRIASMSSYGINPEVQCIAVSEDDATKLSVFYAKYDESGKSGASFDFPILYQKNDSGNIHLCSIGNPASKIYYGRIQKYTPDFGAGLIIPIRYGEILSKERVRFIAEDLANVLPRDLDTLSCLYDVSYTIDIWQDQLPKAKNVCVYQSLRIRPEHVDTDIRIVAELSRQAGGTVEFLNLPTLSNGRKYGIIYFYNPSYGYLKIGNLFKNQKYISGWTDEKTGTEESEKLPVLSDFDFKDANGKSLNTFERIYLVSYIPYGTIDQIELCADYPKRSLWMARIEENRMFFARSTMIPTSVNIEPEELSASWHTSQIESLAGVLPSSLKSATNLVVLPPTEDKSFYGFLFAYNPKAQHFTISNLFINKKTPDSDLVAQSFITRKDWIPNTSSLTLNEPDGGEVDTKKKVYLVSCNPLSPDYHLKILRTWEKKDICALCVQECQLLTINCMQNAVEEVQAEATEAIVPDSNNGEEQELCTELALPILPDDGSQYALVTAYTRRFPQVYFYRATSKQDSDEMKREWTIARGNSKDIQFLDNESHISIRLNTARYCYVVRLKLEASSTANAVPIVRNPVIKIQEFSRDMYTRIELNGCLLKIYGYTGTGITQMMSSIPEEINPPFVKGETLLTEDRNGFHALVCPGSNFQPGNEMTVYRFGILTGLLRLRDDFSDYVGGFLNGDIFFSVSTMDESTRNVVRTAKKRMLLRYQYQDGHIYVSRVLPDMLEEIQWKTGIVTEYGVTAKEIYIDIDVDEDEVNARYSVRHYQTTETDGYVSNAARNGFLEGKKVFLKEILCPETSQEASALIRVATLLHCEREEGVIRYRNKQDDYIAYRYNPKTGNQGTVPSQIYGPEKALASVENQRVDILFAPYPNKNQRLYAFLLFRNDLQNSRDLLAYLKSAQATEDGPVRLPEDVTHIAQKKTDSRSQPFVENLPMGQFLLQVETQNSRYLVLKEYIDQLHSDLGAGMWDRDKEKVLVSLFSSGQWRDDVTAAALWRIPTYRSDLRQRSRKNHTTNGCLRHAFQGRVMELINSGNWQTGEFIANLLPVLESNPSWRRARDLYIYLLPCFVNRWEIPEKIRKEVTEQHFIPDTDDLDEKDSLLIQEYIRSLRELFQKHNNRKKKEVEELASRLLPHLFALDDTSLDFFHENIASAIPYSLLKAIEYAADFSSEINDSPALVSDFFLKLKEQRKRLFDWKNQCILFLSASFGRNEKVSTAVSKLPTMEGFATFERSLDYNDRENLENLISICQKKVGIAGESGSSQLYCLEDLEKRISKFRNQIVQHPTNSIITLFYANNKSIPEEIHREIIAAIHEMCMDERTLPVLRCSLNESSLCPGQKNFIINLENGKAGDRMRRDIRNIKIRLESCDNLIIKGVKPEFRTGPSILRTGERCGYDVEFNADLHLQSQYHISLIVEYEYLASANYDVKARAYCPCYEHTFKEEALCLTFADAFPKKVDMQNPYDFWQDRALDSTSGMFFGRNNEKTQALDYLLGKDRSGLKPGATLIIYGQKRCGKTSFLKELTKEIEARSEAIILRYDDIYMTVCSDNPEELPHFMGGFYRQMLDDFLSEIERRGSHMIILAKTYREIISKFNRHEHSSTESRSLYTRLFRELMRDFSALDGKRSRIVLIVDEFTRLCTQCRNQFQTHPELGRIPEFIRSFSEQWGFVQIIVGHNSMIQLLSELNVINRTTQTSMELPLCELDNHAAWDMIQIPMKNVCNFNPYETKSGADALKMLLDLSGCYPNYLMYLCANLFNFYQSVSSQYISMGDIYRMLEKWWENEIPCRKPYVEGIFDPILGEDDYSIECRAEIRSYLTFIAEKTYDSMNYQCDRNEICPGLTSVSRNREIRDILIKRNVFDESNGRIRIKVGLYRDYIHRKKDT